MHSHTCLNLADIFIFKFLISLKVCICPLRSLTFVNIFVAVYINYNNTVKIIFNFLFITAAVLVSNLTIIFNYYFHPFKFISVTFN